MATPTLRALKTHYGGRARLIGVMRPYVADVLAGTTWLDQTIDFDRRASDHRLCFRSVVRQLRDLNVRTAILLPNSLRTAWLAYAARIPQRIGYARYGRGPLLTQRLQPPRSGWNFTPISAVDYYLELAVAVGATAGSRRPELATTVADEGHADQIWSRCGFATNQRVVVLNSGGAYGAAKDWPAEHFAALARRLVSLPGVRVLVLCGPAERATAKRIVELSNSLEVSSIADQPLGLGLSKALIRRSALLISTDSGPRHFGAAFDVPTVTLFGPTDPRWSHNYNPRGLELQHAVPCGPCGSRQCPLRHHRCMQDLSVDQVFRAARQLLSSETCHRVA